MICCAAKGFGFLEDPYHLIDGYEIRIVQYCIGLPETTPSAQNLFDPGPPCQGGSAHVVSGHEKDGSLKIGAMGQGSRSYGRKDQSGWKDHQDQQGP